MKGDDVSDRMVAFGATVLDLAEALPQTRSGRHVADQVMRSGTSCGANFEEGRGAESRADFVHKLSVTHKELKETRYWLRVVVKRKMSDGVAVELLEECEELCAIIGKSISTAKGGRKESVET
ncbi:four helix bundle protein [bacterium]|nr:four helix bundle protein [bacterium]